VIESEAELGRAASPAGVYGTVIEEEQRVMFPGAYLDDEAPFSEVRRVQSRYFCRLPNDSGVFDLNVFREYTSLPIAIQTPRIYNAVLAESKAMERSSGDMHDSLNQQSAGIESIDFMSLDDHASKLAMLPVTPAVYNSVLHEGENVVGAACYLDEALVPERGKRCGRELGKRVVSSVRLGSVDDRPWPESQRPI
jgi:hypothetical protein